MAGFEELAESVSCPSTPFGRPMRGRALTGWGSSRRERQHREVGLGLEFWVWVCVGPEQNSKYMFIIAADLLLC